MSRQTLRPGEMYLGSRDPLTGAVLREGRFKLVEGSRVTFSLQGLQPPVIAIGEQGRDTQPFASTVVFSDNSAGIGIYYHDAAASVNRIWWGTMDVRYRRQTTLLKLKTDRGRPAVDTRVPQAGGVFADKVWAAWNGQVHTYTEGATTPWSAALRTLTGSAVPTNNPVEWEGGWLWPLGTSGIDIWNGTAWWNVAKPCVGLLTYANQLFCVSAAGQVSNVTAAIAAPKIVAGTLAAGDLTDRVKVSDTCSGMFLFSTGDANSDLVPHVLGKRTIYQIDAAGASPTYAAFPAGPGFPPHRYPITADVLGSDTNAYISQGMSVVQWTGDVASPAGLDVDDGVPIQYKGGILQLLNGGHNLFALVDATKGASSAAMLIYGDDVAYADVMEPSVGFSWVASRETRGWVVRATGDTLTLGANRMWISTAEGTYRLWFNVGTTLYSIDLEEGLFNPLGDTSGRYEPTGTIDYPVVDFGYAENHKLGLLVEVRTKMTGVSEPVLPYIRFDEGATWWPLYNQDGTHGIATDGRHTFVLHANMAPTAPGVYVDEPAVGHQFDKAQLRLTAARGDSRNTPAIDFVALHAIKLVEPLISFRLNVDLMDSYQGRSPWEQRTLLRDMLADNGHGLLHFGYHDDPEATTPGDTQIVPVKVTAISGLDHGSLGKDYQGRVSLDLSRVTMP